MTIRRRMPITPPTAVASAIRIAVPGIGFVKTQQKACPASIFPRVLETRPRPRPHAREPATESGAFEQMCKPTMGRTIRRTRGRIPYFGQPAFDLDTPPRAQDIGGL